MKREDTNRFVLIKVRVIQSIIDELDGGLDVLEFELSEAKNKESISRFLSKIKIFKTLLENISKLVDEIELKLVQSPPDPPNPSPKPPPPRLKQIHMLTIKPSAFGAAEVSINNHVPFSLPPNLASLLEILAMDDGIPGTQNGNDPLVGFKKTYMIRLNMTKILAGKPYTQHALRQSIYRLRKIMTENGFDGLIQTNRQLEAYRLALRRKQDPNFNDE